MCFFIIKFSLSFTYKPGTAQDSSDISALLIGYGELKHSDWAKFLFIKWVNV